MLTTLQAMRNIVSAIEIGTAKVVVLIAEVVHQHSLNIIGIGQSTSRGVQKGEVVDFKSASSCVHAAIQTAEHNAGAQAESAVIAQTGRQLQAFCHNSSIRVAASDNIVSPNDMQRAIREAKSKQLRPGRVYVHHICNGFRLDNHAVANPLNLQGEQLEVTYWHVHSDEQTLSNNIHIANGFGLEVTDIILSSIASGCMATQEQERNNGVMVLDIGCGTTDYALYEKGYIVHTGVIPVGGAHLTNDLALGLRTSYKHAEALKLRCGEATFDRRAPSKRIWIIGDQAIGDRTIPSKALDQILNARLTELFELIKQDVGDRFNSTILSGGVILTGGTSRLPAIEQLAASILGVEVRKAQPSPWVKPSLRGPEYSTVLGLLHYTLVHPKQNLEASSAQNGFLKKMFRFLNLT